jgi:hypothetical protein
MDRKLAITLVGAALFTFAPASTPALAQDAAEAAPSPQSTEEAKAAARELANRGYELYQAGNYKEAIQYFRDAEARFHAPTLLIMQAKAHENINNLIEARGLYMQIARESLPDNASKEFKQAHKEATDAVERIKGRIPKLKIVLTGGKPEHVQVTIDGIPVPNSILERPLEVNPGVRKVVATIETKDGGRSVYQTANLREGRIKQIKIVLRAGGAVVAAPQEDEVIDDGSGGSWVPAGIAFGFGAAGLGVGAVTGLLWMNERDKITEQEDKCKAAMPVDPTCSEKIQPSRDKAKTLGTVAIVGFAAGGVGLAVGTILAITRKPEKTAETATGVTSVAVGPGSVLVRGAF